MQPTLCSRCKKNVAVVFISKMEGDKTTNEGLCLKCAKELGLPQVDDMMKRMGISDEDLDTLNNEMLQAMSGVENIEDLPGGEDGLAIESKTLTLGAYGGDMDFYAMKGAIEAILQELRVKDVTFRIGSGLPEELSYHAGRFAEVWSGSDCLGWFGQIFLSYIAWYGFGRGIIEGLRTDSLYFFGLELFGVPIRTSQVLAIVSAAVAAVVLIYELKFRRHDPSELYVNRLAAHRADAGEGPGGPEKKED